MMLACFGFTTSCDASFPRGMASLHLKGFGRSALCSKRPFGRGECSGLLFATVRSTGIWSKRLALRSLFVIRLHGLLHH